MQIAFTELAESIIASAVASGERLHLTHYRLGNKTAILGEMEKITSLVDAVDPFFTGESGVPHQGFISIRKSPVDPEAVTIKLNLGPTDGPEAGFWAIGNLVLYTSKGEPFLVGSLANHINKWRTGPLGVGNDPIFNFTVKFSGLAQIINITLANSCSVEVPSVANQTVLPEPGDSPHGIYIMEGWTENCRPGLVYAVGDVWYGTQFDTSIHDQKWGVVDGGTRDDRYCVCPVRDGGLYRQRWGDVRSGSEVDWEDFDGGLYGSPLDVTGHEDYCTYDRPSVYPAGYLASKGYPNAV